MKNKFSSLTMAAVLLTSGQAFAQQESFEVTVTNITSEQTFTPIFVASHEAGVRLFTLGQPAGEGLVSVAEAGDTGPLEALAGSPFIDDVATSSGLLNAGQTATITVSAAPDSVISVVSMLIPTNDAFFAVNAAAVPADGSALRVRSPAYDAGSELNDELCANIPGPVCGGEGLSPDSDGEGFVSISRGIQGVGDLTAERDWRNPVAEITVRRIGQ